MKLVDLDSYDSADDALGDLRDQYPSVFSGQSDDEATTTGRTAPRMNNGRKKLTKETDEQKASRLAKRFPVLQGRVSPR